MDGTAQPAVRNYIYHMCPAHMPVCRPLTVRAPARLCAGCGRTGGYWRRTRCSSSRSPCRGGGASGGRSSSGGTSGGHSNISASSASSGSRRCASGRSRRSYGAASSADAGTGAASCCSRASTSSGAASARAGSTPGPRLGECFLRPSFHRAISAAKPARSGCEAAAPVHDHKKAGDVD